MNNESNNSNVTPSNINPNLASGNATSSGVDSVQPRPATTSPTPTSPAPINPNLVTPSVNITTTPAEPKIEKPVEVSSSNQGVVNSNPTFRVEPTPVIEPSSTTPMAEIPGSTIPPVIEPTLEPSYEEPPRKKRSGFKVILILLILILLGVGGYFAYDYFIAKDEEKSEPKQEEKLVLGKLDEAKEYVYEADYSNVIDFDKEAGTCPISKTSLKVPYINLNNDVAADINSEIKALYEQAVGKYRANVTLDSQDSCTTVAMAYKYYQNEEYASVVVAYAESTKGVADPTFYTYTISTRTGELVEDYTEIKALSNMAKTSDEQLLQSVKTEAMNKYANQADNLYSLDKMKTIFGKAPATQTSNWKEFCATLTVEDFSKNVEEKKIQAYLTENKQLGLILTKYVPEQGKTFNEMYTLK